MASSQILGVEANCCGPIEVKDDPKAKLLNRLADIAERLSGGNEGP